MSTGLSEPKKTLFTDYEPDLVRYKARAKKIMKDDEQEEHYTPAPLPYHYATSVKLVQAAAISASPSHQIRRKPVSARTTTEDNLAAHNYTTWNSGERPALVEGTTYTSRPQIHRAPTGHRFSQFLDDGNIKSDLEGEDVEPRRSSLHPFETG